MRRLLFYALLVGLLAVDLFPLFWILDTAFKPTSIIQAYPPQFLYPPTLEHFAASFERSGFAKSFVDSTIVGVIVTAISVVLGSMLAFAMARYRVGGHTLAFWVLSQRMLPPVAVVMPLFIMFRTLHLHDTYLALILTYSAVNVPLATWLMRSFMRDVPREIDDAALIDGCSPWDVLWRIMLPLVRPGLVATAIFCLIASWNEFLFALIVVGGDVKAVPLVVASVITDKQVLWGPMAAIGLMAALPMTVFAILAQRHLVRGLTFGAVK